jgi:hypothetical protein
MDVYAQLQQRVDRQHGTNFDRLVRKARKQLAGIPAPSDGPGLGHLWDTRRQNAPDRRLERRWEAGGNPLPT